MRKVNLSNFNEIQNLKLRVYNRVVTLFNLIQTEGKEVGEEYMAQFSDAETKQIFIMTQYIKHKGAAKVAQEMILSTQPTAAQGEEHVDDEETIENKEEA